MGNVLLISVLQVIKLVLSEILGPEDQRVDVLVADPAVLARLSFNIPLA